MVGSTGNHSGASSSAYPPSLNDTSVSSASGGRPGWRNAPIHTSNSYSYSDREQQQQQRHYASPNRQNMSDHHQHYQYPQRNHDFSPKISRSIDYSEYQHPRDMAAMSDPGESRPDRGHDRYRSQIEHEYARSETAAPSSPYYDSEHRHRNFSRYESKPHLYSQNRYSPAPIRRNSPSPPLPHQPRDSGSRVNPYLSRNSVTARRELPVTTGSEDYHDGMYNHPSPSYNERSPTTNNLKERMNKLFSGNEALQARGSQVPRSTRRLQHSLSPMRQYRQSSLQKQQDQTEPPYTNHTGPVSHSNNLPRFARSLSPRRRQYQTSSSITNEGHSMIQKASSTISDSSYNNRGHSVIQKAGSTISDSSYNNRFHSKFYEAALVAQRNGDESQNRMWQNQQQQGRRRELSSPRKVEKEYPEKYSHPSPRGNKLVPSSSSLPRFSNEFNQLEIYGKAPGYLRSGSGTNLSSSKADGYVRRPPIIPPSPSSSSSPAGSSDPKKRSYRIRPPSPNLVERIRSFESNEQHNDPPGPNVSQGEGYNQKRAVDSHYGRPSNHNSEPMNHHNNPNGNNSPDVLDSNSVKSRKFGNPRRSPTIDKPIDHIQSDFGHNFDNGIHRSSDRVSGAINEQNREARSPPKQHGYLTEQSPIDADEVEKDSMANLVGMLSAVNRENPESALAQIDSILRQQESHGSRARPFENPRGLGGTTTVNSKPQRQNSRPSPESAFSSRDQKVEKQEDATSDNEEDDDSSDVSSITNPTYQPTSSTRSPYPTTGADALYIRENDHYNMHSGLDYNKLAFNPSTSSFRRPRPSHLENYSKPTSPIPPDAMNGMSRSEWKRQQLKKDPPPSTIKMKDDSLSNESPRQRSSDVREKILQKNTEKQAKKIEKQRTGVIVYQQPKKKLDNFLADKQHLAEKIRGWDELSNQVSTSRSEQEENVQGKHRSKPVSSKRHPWGNNNIHAIQTKDTSMEEANGVEAEMVSTGHRYSSDNSKLESSIDGPAAGDLKRTPFEKARKNIKDRSTRNKPVPDASFDSEQDGSNGMPSIKTSMSGIPQFNPREQHETTYEQKSRNEEDSSNNGSSWVAMPPSSFFPDVEDDCDPISRKQNSINTKLSEPKGSYQKGQSGRLNLSSARYDEAVPESRSLSRSLACTVGNKLSSKPREKKRGFLRGFLEKKKTKPGTAGYSASMATSSVADHSTSVESRGVKSASQLQSNSRTPSQSSPKRSIQTSIEVVEPANPPEKFRSSSMAQKFNRVMELYDSDEA